VAAEAVLIAGGYGVVGRRIAADLAPDYPVIVAGRRLEHAHAIATAIGQGVRARTIDVTAKASIDAALEGVAVVVSCIDQPQRLLLHAAIDRGLQYTDITPHLTELGRAAAFDALVAAARASGARVVLGTGIVPGISNVVVRALATLLGGADTIDTSLLLSASDASGPASFDYFLTELAMPFEVHIEGTDRPARPFSNPRPIEFPPPFGTRSAYLFPFSDQVLYPRTLGVHTVVTRLALEPGRVARLLAAAVRLGALRLVARQGVRRVMMGPRTTHPAAGEPRFALRVDVARGRQSLHATLVGPAQADAAAVGASATARALIAGEVSQPGVWMPEQVLNPQRFFSHLAAHHLTVELPVVHHHDRSVSGATTSRDQN